MSETVTLETTAEERAKWAKESHARGVWFTTVQTLCRDIDRLLADNAAHERSEDRPTSEEVESVRDIAMRIVREAIEADGEDEGPLLGKIEEALIAERRRLAAQSDGWRPILEGLRSEGWAVGCHNDYFVAGEQRTFWLMTSRNGRWVKGEANTDEAALAECRQQVEAWKETYPHERGNLDWLGPVLSQTLAERQEVGACEIQRTCDALSHDDLCYLSRVFNRTADPRVGNPDERINEWLKVMIRESKALSE